MLAEIEKKTAALLAGAMASRTHLTVTAAPGPPAPEGEGKEVAVVSITEVKPDPLFSAERFSLQLNPAQSRRILPVSFITTVEFAIRPTNTSAGLAAARTLLLDDLSLSSHFLARDTIRNGADFAVANPDPGFKVRAFAILKNGVDRDPQQGLLTARLECRGEAEIWPPGQPTPEGKIAAVDVNMIAQPVDVLPAHPSVSTGGTLRLRIRGLPARRGPAAAPSPFAIGVRVLSDAPPDQSGSIVNGGAGAESNLRIITAGSPDTEVQYKAPTSGVENTRIEVVTIFFATPEGKPGAFIAAVPVQVTGGG